jgi:hyperosmotically inducible protein
MRAIRAIMVLLLVVIVAVLAYNYRAGHGWTLQPPTASGGIDAERVRDTGASVAQEAAATARTVVERTEEVVGDASLTAKIKSKMALDDTVKAMGINVNTSGSVVTLSGVVGSEAERKRAVQLARETAGVSAVIDRMSIGTR